MEAPKSYCSHATGYYLAVERNGLEMHMTDKLEESPENSAEKS